MSSPMELVREAIIRALGESLNREYDQWQQSVDYTKFREKLSSILHLADQPRVWAPRPYGPGWHWVQGQADPIRVYLRGKTLYIDWYGQPVSTRIIQGWKWQFIPEPSKE